jgi:hypothetical protein
MFKPTLILEHPNLYFGNGRWLRSRYLPRQYRNYNLNTGYKVVLNDYHGNRPYTNFYNDRKKDTTKDIELETKEQ